MRPAIRFHPPNVPMPPGVGWALQRAFGPVGAAVAESSPHEARVQAARRLGLLSRIAFRQPQELISQETGDNESKSLGSRQRAQAARGLALLNAQRQITEVLEQCQLPAALLKFAALSAKGLVSPASRAACDLDILVRATDAARVADALGKLGFVKSALVVQPHQPYVLTREDGVVVELHVHLPYVRTVLGGRHAQFADLEDTLLLCPLADTSAFVRLPTDDLLTAHLMAHGLVQHGLEPKTYPVMRMLCDLIDLGLPENEALALDAFRWLQTDVSYAEFSGLIRLLFALERGDGATLWEQDEPASKLLRHFILGAIDQQYQARVLLQRLLQSVAENGMAKTLRQYAILALWLPDANLRKIYSSTKTSTRLRLERPFSLVWRGVRTLGRAVKKRR